MEIIPDKRRVVGLVEQAAKGDLCLPNFQRDFVWSREEVADLVRSILRGYFIGSLLLLRCDRDRPPFAPVFLRGASPEFQFPKPELLILDGQQRLSSLLYTMIAPNLSLKDSGKQRWFFVDLDLLMKDPDNDEIVFDRSKRELRGLDLPENQYAQHALPCTALLRSDLFLAWRDGFEDWLDTSRPEAVATYKSTWRNAWTTAINEFQAFEVPLVELPRIDDNDSDAIGRVCAIFEKLNSTGVELSVYDLLTARLYRSNIKLHDLWKESCQKHPRLHAWSGGSADKHKFGVLVLRTLALLRGLDPKPRILIDLSPVDFETDWHAAAAAMERALELISDVSEDGFGVFDKKWLPGFGLIPALAALRRVLEEQKLGDQERDGLRRWYWCNVFIERYSSAVESKSRKDYAEMTAHWLDGEPEPDVFAEARDRIGAPGYRIRTSASYASAVYSGVFCLLAIGGAKDWRRLEAIQLQDLQDHHIVPQAYLKRHEFKRRGDVNTIANRTLISDETNNKIKANAPAAYVVDTAIFPKGLSLDILTPHFIDATGLAKLKELAETLSDEQAAAIYEEFLRIREQAIIREIRRVCGVQAPDASRSEDLNEDREELAADMYDGSIDEALVEAAVD